MLTLTQLSVVVLISQVCSAAPPTPVKISRFHEEFIKRINSVQSTWKAGNNFGDKLSIENVTQFFGFPLHYLNSTHNLEHKKYTLGAKEKEIPMSFDSRIQWPDCPTIQEISNQNSEGDCGSCWAVSTVNAISDRHCIHSKNKSVVRYSAQDVMTCCEGCGSGGCEGGLPVPVWHYWVEEGLVSETCKPYQPSHKGCLKQCEQNYSVKYRQDKSYGKKVYWIRENEKEIQREIMENGPVVAVMVIHKDLYYYKSGVYKHTTDDQTAAHAVRIIGWGVEDGTPYWLVANSWGTTWGDKGFFKILRGYDESDIESNVSVGLPN